MTELIITRGLPGSGKSTRARQWVREDPTTRAEVNRDHIRDMLHGGFIGSQEIERMVTTVSHNTIRDLLNKGVSVVCSDTNLPQRNAREIAKIGRNAGADIEVWDMTDVPLHVCLVRNGIRRDKDPVPESVIESMHERFVKGKTYPLPLPEEGSVDLESDVYVPIKSKPKTVIVDIDGTMAHMVSRGPHEYHKVLEDAPDPAVITLVRGLAHAGFQIIFMSGRPLSCYDDTFAWLEEHYGMGFEDLIMRNVGDNRNDAIVKFELFNTHVRHNYNIVFSVDDRNRVVNMWRDKLGIKCLQVAEGNF